jgi:hypothetical protein
VRPATPLICAFIDAHRERFGVAPICHALRIAALPHVTPARSRWRWRSWAGQDAAAAGDAGAALEWIGGEAGLALVTRERVQAGILK